MTEKLESFEIWWIATNKLGGQRTDRASLKQNEERERVLKNFAHALIHQEKYSLIHLIMQGRLTYRWSRGKIEIS